MEFYGNPKRKTTLFYSKQKNTFTLLARNVKI